MRNSEHSSSHCTSAQLKSLDGKNKKLGEEVEAIEADQKRLRENIEMLKGTAEAKQLITRYIAKADTQESRLEQIEKEMKAAETEQAQLKIQFAAAVKEFKFDRNL
jgi:uncharacterized protein YfcZ (UPF0381/DUF406 family)